MDSTLSAYVWDRNVSSTRHENSVSVIPLPLNLIALIISYLDRPSDLARMTRTCRVFHYMTLPQLYSRVSLRSYDHIRYNESDGRPEGCGAASPFSMGLNGLVTRNVAGYVKKFEVCGSFREYELQEHAKVGRVPDGTMMLNCLVRVAIERMAMLESFSWQLNMKMLPTIWQGLALKPTLTHLIVQFPTSRHPRPLILVPPIANLRYLHIFDIDPLCYADDISLLLLGSKQLCHLKLHWSPRMREAREPSIHLAAYFGRVMAANHKLSLKTISITNLYIRNDGQCDGILNEDTIEEVTFLNSTTGLGDDGGSVFMDRNSSWRKSNKCKMTRLKKLRIDKVSREQCAFLGQITGLEKLYLIGSHTKASTSDNANPLPHSPASSTSSPGSSDNSSILALKDDYLNAITRNHGPTLRHLLLLPQWRMNQDDIAIIVRQCPKLEQLGLGTEFVNFEHLRLLVPFLSNLTVFRLLGNPDDPTFVNTMREMDQEGRHENKIGQETINREWSRLKYIELGDKGMIFEIGQRYLAREKREDEKELWKRKVLRRRLKDVKHIDIWAMDSLDS